MIQFRRNPFSETSKEISFVKGETAKTLVERVLTDNGYELTDNVFKHINIVINGLIVERDLWEVVAIDEKDIVLIAPRITRGDGGQLFKQVALITAAIAISVLFTPASGATFWSAVAVAGLTMGASLALNALIPPPSLPGLGAGNPDSSTNDSQMYTLTSQANGVKKFGKVPRVYGTHRMFPVVAANPYTEIEADPDTGTLVQFFYGVYDFGYGPLDISQLSIGETPLDYFEDVQYRLVDFNKPAVEEGYWDEALNHEGLFLKNYKGDVERDGATANIDKNEMDGGAEDGYRIIRFASDKVEDCNQEILLEFICPQGLIAHGTDGSTEERTINLDIKFAKASEPQGSENWIPFNDLNHVYSFKASGGPASTITTYESNVELHPIGGGWVFTNLPSQGAPGYGSVSGAGYRAVWEGSNYPVLRTKVNRTYALVDFGPYGIGAIIEIYFGIPKGATSMVIRDGQSNPGDKIFWQGKLVGTVLSTAAHSTGYETITFTAPIPFELIVYVPKLLQYMGPRELSVLVNNISNGTMKRRYTTVGGGVIRAKSTQPIYATFRFSPKEKAAYKVRITRVSSTSTRKYQIQDKLVLASLSTRFDRAPIITKQRHTFLELKIKATNQLSGSLTNLSGVATSILDVYDADTQTWSKQPTSNPAWILVDLLTGTVNPKAISKDRLHIESILEWAEYCDTVINRLPVSIDPDDGMEDYPVERFGCNFILDFNTTLHSLIQSVTQSAQASLNVIDGKYGVLVDKLRTTPVQIFTSRNSWDFSSSRSYDSPPHAINVRYVEPGKNWEVTEVVVYDDGYDSNTATVFEDLSTFGCTSRQQAWRYGRYMMAQARLRKETISLTVDFEHLVCTRGDFVQISNDVMKTGGKPARVIEIIGADEVKIDDSIETSGLLDYGYVCRTSDGIKTSTVDVIAPNQFKLYGDMPAVNDLIIIGEVGKVVVDCLVKSISPNSDLSATLTLVEKADQIFGTEDGSDIPLYDPRLNAVISNPELTPGPVESLEAIENSWRIIGSAYEYYVILDWEVPTSGGLFETFEIYANDGTGFKLIDYVKESIFEYVVDSSRVDFEHSFKVLAVSPTGNKLSLVDAETILVTPAKKLSPPSDVENLYLNITGEVIQLDWAKVSDVDLKEYLIRYSPITDNATWETSIPLMRADRNTTSVSTQGRTGTYFIKAYDYNGNQSATAAQARTTIPNIFDLNVVEETNDFPDLLGEKDKVEVQAGGLILQKAVVDGVENTEFYPEGFYNYTTLLDMGEIYTVRIQSYIEAEGFTMSDIMENWETLEDVETMSIAGDSDWDVETQWRGTDSLNPMSEWEQLDLIETLGEGNVDNWTPWRKFTVSDVTARVLQFRLRLVSNKANTTARVFNGVVKADMPDRTEIYNNIVAPVEGYEVVYSPAFKGPGTTPNIQITQDASESGDYAVLENKTLNGFKITFYDINNVAVERQFDAFVKGYGRKSTVVI